MTEVTEEQQKCYLRHMLGAEPHVPKRDWGYRNRFCASVGDPADQDLSVMAEMGLVVRGATINGGKQVFYHVTEAGMDAIGLTKKQKANAMEN